MRRARPVVGLLVGLAACLGACQASGPDYQHSRYDYWSFRARAGRLPEPNYLPWALHEESLPFGGKGLIVCRWPDAAFPLHYYIAPPVIREEMQDEFARRDPQDYVGAVESAFTRWQEAIGRPVRFVRVDTPEQATLLVHLQAGENETQEGHVLGLVRGEEKRCRVAGSDDVPERFRIEYAVHDTYLFINDSVGLLTPGQVHAIALHEIGHVLGASGQHSPLRGDVMYQIASDRRVDVLSQHDTNTLRALYMLAPGSLYARTDQPHDPPIAEVRRGPPRLDSELRDERFDIEVRFPRGWQVIRSPRGWVAVDGLSWDYDASVQVVASRGEFDSALAQSSLGSLSGGNVERSELLELDGQPIALVVASGGGRTEEISLIGWQKGWVVFVIADCRSSDYQLYQPWFRSVLLSLDHPSAHRDAPPGPAAPRD